MTNAERQARHHLARATAQPVIHYRRAADRRSDRLHDTATNEALQAIVDLELDDLLAIEPPARIRSATECSA